MSQRVGTDAAGAESAAENAHARGVRRLIEHVSLPLYRNAYSLIMSSVLTAGIGILFWFLAARLYSEESVGLNSVAISTLMFLATLGQLNLVNGLNRFLPRAGIGTRRLIGMSYLIAVGIGGIVAGIFLLGIDIWSADIGFLASNPWMAAWFVVSVMAWCLFVLQDGVLTGLRQAQWVPVENVVYAVAKLVLVVVLAASFSSNGLFLAWTIPIPPLLLIVNIFVFRRLVPRHVVATEGRSEPVVFSHVSRFVAGDYAASLSWMAATRLMPVMVLAQVGAAGTAHFYLAWIVAYTLYLASRQMGMSLIAEAAHDQSGLPSLSYRAARQALLLIGPAVVVVVVGAPLILRLFGDAYAVAATPLLRFLALSALPAVITTIYAAILRVERRIRALVVVMVVQSGTVIVLSWWLLGTQGIVGVGIAWLVAQTATAVFILLTELGPMWISQVDPRVVDAGARLQNAATRSRTNRRLRPIAATALSHFAAQHANDVPGEPSQWEILHIFSTVSDVSTVSVGPAGGPAEAVLKLSKSDWGRDALEQHTAAMEDIERDRRLSDWEGNIPDILAVDEVDGRLVVVDRAVNGEPLTTYLPTTDSPENLLTPPAALISDFHRCTASRQQVGDDLIQSLVRTPLDAVREATSDRADWADALIKTEAWLTASLRGKTLTISRTHGDFAPDNILLSGDGSEVSGIIDWDQAKPSSLPDLDIAFLLLTTRMAREHKELGTVVVELTNAAAFEDWEHRLLDRYGLNSSRSLDVETLVVLAWLHHATSNLTKAARYRSHQIWLERNVGHVLNTR